MWARAAAGRETSCTVFKTFVDSNVLVYAADRRAPAKSARAQEWLRSPRARAISTQVMLEFHAVLTRKFEPRLSLAEARSAIHRLRTWEVVPADATLVLQAARTAEEHQLSIWDAMIVEAAVLAGCAELWTEDLTHGHVIRGVTVVNPFEDIN